MKSFSILDRILPLPLVALLVVIILAIFLFAAAVFLASGVVSLASPRKGLSLFDKGTDFLSAIFG